MRGAPVGALPEDKTAPGEELEDVVPRREDLPLERLPAPHHIAHPLVGLTRNAHRHELADTIRAMRSIHFFSLGRSLASLSSRVGVLADWGKTAIVIESLWTSMPR